MKIDTKNILAMHINGVNIISVYMRGQLIWPTTSLSCFSNGYWLDEYPWTDNIPWTD